MDDIAVLDAGGAAEGVVVVADEQTAGKGRAGRSWNAAPGTALLCSILLRPSVPPHRLAVLPLLAGVATAEAIERCASVACQIKWPNDLWITGKKVGGILTTARTSGAEVEVVVLGIGINLAGAIGEKMPGATSIAQASGRIVERETLLDALLAALEERYDTFIQTNGAFDRSDWLDRAALLQEPVFLQDHGRERRGTFVGIDDEGALLLQTEGEILRIVAGDMTRGPIAQ